ncbi:MAG: EF-P beta-lysylation protein EpmB [Gammaproteobacteria bacterium]
MIPELAAHRHVPDWQQALADAIRDPAELLRVLGLPAELPGPVREAEGLFPLLAPRGFVARMRKGDPHDPLLRQVLPLGEECRVLPGFSIDPVGDGAAQQAPGLLHKYAGRALMITTGACAVHCRYCFRRHYPYAEQGASRSRWSETLAYLADSPDTDEIILSGGDPLTLSDAKLGELVQALESVAHLQRLRIHTRLPVVLPERITQELLDILAETRLKVVIVVHANHPNEIDATVGAACAALAERHTVLNQAVLLRGVNDDARVLAELSERLFAHRVLPYYLHLLDRVQGAAHFEVPVDEARKIMRDLHARLPGYLLPRLAREVAGTAGKQLLGVTE